MSLIETRAKLKRLENAVYIPKEESLDFENKYLGVLRKIINDPQKILQYEVSKNFNNRIVDFYRSKDIDCDVKFYIKNRRVGKVPIDILNFSNEEIFNMRLMSFCFNFDFTNVIDRKESEWFFDIFKEEFSKLILKIESVDHMEDRKITSILSDIELMYLHEINLDLTNFVNNLLLLKDCKFQTLYFVRNILRIFRKKGLKNPLKITVPNLKHVLFFYQESIDITNEVGLSHTLHDVFYSFSLCEIFKKQHLDYHFIEIDKIPSVTSTSVSIEDICVFRPRVTLLEAVKNYSHSHVNGLSNIHFCRGLSNIDKRLISDYNYCLGFDFFKMLIPDSELTDHFKEFLLMFHHEFNSLLEWESLDGGPYTRIDEVYNLTHSMGHVNYEDAKRKFMLKFQSFKKEIRDYYFGINKMEHYNKYLYGFSKSNLIRNFSHIDDDELRKLNRDYENTPLNSSEEIILRNKILVLATNKAFNPDWSINMENIHYFIALFSSVLGYYVFSNSNFLKNFLIESENNEDSIYDRTIKYLKDASNITKERVKTLSENKDVFIEFQDKKYYKGIIEDTENIFQKEEKTLTPNDDFKNLIINFQNNILTR